jgi:activating signal cointegrator 1
MRGLTLTQPWATLVAIGAKRIETRSWSTAYRGPIAIHAAKGWPRICRDLVFKPPFDQVLIKYMGTGMNVLSVIGIQNLPVGAILATANIVDCVPTNLDALSRLVHPPIGSVNEHEYEFGDYSIGRFAWILSDIRALKTPVPCKGALGLWSVSAEITEKIKPGD